jgi:hypothetical protein
MDVQIFISVQIKRRQRVANALKASNLICLRYDAIGPPMYPYLAVANEQIRLKQ